MTLFIIHLNAYYETNIIVYSIKMSKKVFDILIYYNIYLKLKPLIEVMFQ